MRGLTLDCIGGAADTLQRHTISHYDSRAESFNRLMQGNIVSREGASALASLPVPLTDSTLPKVCFSLHLRTRPANRRVLDVNLFWSKDWPSILLPFTFFIDCPLLFQNSWKTAKIEIMKHSISAFSCMGIIYLLVFTEGRTEPN